MMLRLPACLMAFLLTVLAHSHGDGSRLALGEREWAVETVEGTSDEDFKLWTESSGAKLVRKMRGHRNLYIVRTSDEPRMVPSWVGWHRRQRRRRTRRALDRVNRTSRPVVSTYLQHPLIRHLRSIPTPSLRYNDPLWNKQWQLHERFVASQLPRGPNAGSGHYPRLVRADHRIGDVWDGMNLSGRGVVVSIVDDGLDYLHADLAANYDPSASYDLNDDDPDPMPGPGELNSHGTRGAGIIAMVANNSVCGVGIAHGARIGAIRLLDGHLTDAIEAEAFSFQQHHIDIMSISWGPADDGKSVERPGPLSSRALERGVREGRSGLGTIYVWASGNGGTAGDDCAADGYASSPYSFTVAAVARDGSVPWYGESCASTLVSTYSTGGDSRSDSIITTEPGESRCTTNHTGTSAATSIAVGILALVLEANPRLTWRDVQHLAVWTADPEPVVKSLPSAADQWRVNSLGLLYHSKLGFGPIDALRMAREAQQWVNVPALHVCHIKYEGRPYHVGSSDESVIALRFNGCRGRPANEVLYVEHVQLLADIQADTRGNVELWLESPHGSRSRLINRRPLDTSSDGFPPQWSFTSVQFWGEQPIGKWRLRVYNHGQPRRRGRGSMEPAGRVTLSNISLKVWGSADEPEHYRKLREGK